MTSNSASEPAFGIDLGTTNSCIAAIRNGVIEVIPSRMGERITPSVVRFVSSDEVVVGNRALQHAILDPTHTIRGIKRLIGRTFGDVIEFVHSLPYEVLPDEEDNAAVAVDGVLISPEMIQGLILRSLANDVAATLGTPVDRAVIGVPAYFSIQQRHATYIAAQLAGVEVDRIVAEPVLASLGWDGGRGPERKIAVFDLGGGTFDVSILEIGAQVQEVLAIDGDGFLGGDDFDDHLLDWVADTTGTPYSVVTEPHTQQYLRSTIVAAKHALSSQESAEIYLPMHVTEAKGGSPKPVSLVNSDFNLICEELFNRLREPCLRALREARLKPSQIDSVLLVGGATRMRAIDELIRDIFHRPPARTTNPDEAIAIGAALQAGITKGHVKELVLLDVQPHALGIMCADGLVAIIVEANTTIPTEKKETFAVANSAQTSVEAVIVEIEAGKNGRLREVATLRLDNLNKSSDVTPTVQITVSIDVNGTGTAAMREIATGKEFTDTFNRWRRWDNDKLQVLKSMMPSEAR